MMSEDPYVFLAIDYFATGEGRSIFLLVTRAYPTHEDYEVEPKWDFEKGYIPGVLKTSSVDIARREMLGNGVDPYFMIGVDELQREEFVSKYSHLLPEVVLKILNQDKNDMPGNFKYFVELHFNYS